MPKRVGNLTGKTFGSWQTLERGIPIRKNRTTWICRCKCGTVRTVAQARLLNKKSTSCGCRRKRPIAPSAKFGYLTVIRRGQNKEGRAIYECICTCGSAKTVTASNLRFGNTRSCGCLRNKLKEQTYQKVFPPNQNRAVERIWNNYTRSAARRGLPWELTVDQFKTLITSPCFYTGRPPTTLKIVAGKHKILYNGIDRRDNTKGYTISNCVPACTDANIAKMDLSEEDFLALVKQIYIHRIKENKERRERDSGNTDPAGLF